MDGGCEVVSDTFARSPCAVRRCGALGFGVRFRRKPLNFHFSFSVKLFCNRLSLVEVGLKSVALALSLSLVSCCTGLLPKLLPVSHRRGYKGKVDTHKAPTAGKHFHGNQHHMHHIPTPPT
jgi:hypothetical protein